MILIGNITKAQIDINEFMPCPNTNETCTYDQSLFVENNYKQFVGCGRITIANCNEWIELDNPICSDIDISNWLFLNLIKY